ncbi:unnamed protein product [Spirodela intermedia]|uniref:Uncharacterized protein n=1 Tax=Spirodela intermedia TaxID=51605 RepID=A0A7I8I9I2_SPIIN|nr:unnamed protein product [Spirodela intermedia]CAA6654315.1 unnamed protein product [Spirodela intermedia]
MGMEPVCSQAFGSRNLPLVVCSLQRTIVMLLLASIPIALLWVNLQAVMLWLGQDPETTRVAGLYCLFALPDLLANSFLHPIRVYMRSKATLQPLLWCTSLAVLLHLPLTAVLGFTLRLGVPGVAVAACCTNFVTLFFLLVYMLYVRKPKEPLYTGPGMSWGPLVRLALPSCLGVCLEWWWYELMTLAAGYLPHPRVTLGTSAIVIQTTSLLYMLPATLSSSVSVRVGNELGAGQPGKARLAAVVAMGLAAAASFVSLLWTTSDGEVLQLTSAVLPIIGLCELANCPQTTGCGVLRGSARPTIAFFLDLGFLGLCYGLLAAQMACALSIVTAVCRTDWDRESSKAKALVGARQRSAVALAVEEAQEHEEFPKQLAPPADKGTADEDRNRSPQAHVNADAYLT